MENGADCIYLQFLDGTDLLKDFKFKMSLIPPSILGLTKMGDIGSPDSCLVWAVTLFPSKFCISCLANSDFTSLKEY